MNTSLHRYELSLDQRGLLEIPDLAGVRVTCRTGCLWLTLDHDQRDIVLEPGKTFVGGEHRRALLYALDDSTVSLHLEADGALARQAPRFSFSPGLAVA